MATVVIVLVHQMYETNISKLLWKLINIARTNYSIFGSGERTGRNDLEYVQCQQTLRSYFKWKVIYCFALLHLHTSFSSVFSGMSCVFPIFFFEIVLHVPFISVLNNIQHFHMVFFSCWNVPFFHSENWVRLRPALRLNVTSSIAKRKPLNSCMK